MSEKQATVPQQQPPAWPAYYEDEIDLREYVDVLRRRWLLVLGIPAVAVVVAAILSFFVLPPEYEATAGVVVLKARTEVEFAPNIRTDLGQDVDIQSRREALQTLVTSRTLAAQIIEQLGDRLPADQRRVDALLDSVSSTLNGDLLTIKVTNKDPDLAAEIANAWVDTYTTYVNPLFSDVAQRPETLAPQVQDAEQTYQDAEQTLVQFLADNQIERLQRDVNDLQQRVNKRYGDLRELDNLIDDAGALRTQLERGSASSISTTFGNSLAAVFLRARTFTVQSDAQLNTQLQLDPAAWANSPQDAASWQRELEALLSTLESRREALAQLVQDNQWEERLLSLQSDLERQRAREKELTDARDLTWDTFTSLRRKYAEVKVATEAPDLQVSTAMHAGVPEQPVGPRKLLNVVLAGALGLMVGVFGAFFLEFLEDEEPGGGGAEAQGS